MTPQEKRKQTIRKQEKAKFQAFLKRREHDRAEELEAQEAIYNYMKAKGRNTFPYSYGE